MSQIYESLIQGAELKIALVPVGGLSPLHLDKHSSRLRSFSTITLTTYQYMGTFCERGFLRLRYVSDVDCSKSQWEDIFAQQRCLAVVGFCHCPSTPDLPAAFSQFCNAAAARYPSAVVTKCCAFEMSEAQLTDPRIGEMLAQGLKMFPPNRELNDPDYESFLTDLCSEIMRRFDDMSNEADDAIRQLSEGGAWPSVQNSELRWLLNGTQSTYPDDALLKTLPSDAKRRRRQCGRLCVWIASRCLLMGSSVDARCWFEKAIAVCHQVGDGVWEAVAHEGLASALLCAEYDKHLAGRLLDNLATDPYGCPCDAPACSASTSSSHATQTQLLSHRKRRPNPRLAFIAGVQQHLTEAISLYSKQRGQAQVLEIKTILKLARYYASCFESHAEVGVREAALNIEQGSYYLSNECTGEHSTQSFAVLPQRTALVLQLIADAKRALGTQSLGIGEKIQLELELALLSEALGLRRKFAFHLFETATHHISLQRWNTAHALMQLAGQHYGLRPLLRAPVAMVDPPATRRGTRVSSRSSSGSLGMYAADHSSAATTAALADSPARAAVASVGESAAAGRNGRSAAGHKQRVRQSWTVLRRIVLLRLLELSKQMHNHELCARYAMQLLHLSLQLTGAGSNASRVYLDSVGRKTAVFGSGMAKDPPSSTAARDGDTVGTRSSTPVTRSPSAASTASWSTRVASDGSADQAKLVAELHSATNQMPQNLWLDDVCFPVLANVAVVAMQPACNPILKASRSSTSAKEPFLVTPKTFNRISGTSEGMDIKWVQRELAEVRVELHNPMSFDVPVDSISLLTAGDVEVETFPASVLLPAHSSSNLVSLSARPLHAGRATILGCRIGAFNFVSDHFVSKSAMNESDSKVGEEVGVDVLNALPQLTIRHVSPRSTNLVMLDGEARCFRITVENTGSIPVENLRVEAKARFIPKPTAPPRDSCCKQRFHPAPRRTVGTVSTVVFDTDGSQPEPSSPRSRPRGGSACAHEVGRVVALGELRASFEKLARPGQGRHRVVISPGESIVIAVTIQGRLKCCSAALSMSYSSEGSYERCLVLPFSMDVSPSLRVLSGRILCDGAIPRSRERGRVGDTDSAYCRVVLDIENPTRQMFNVQCAMAEGRRVNRNDESAAVTAVVEGLSIQRVVLQFRRFTQDVATCVTRNGHQSQTDALHLIDQLLLAILPRWKSVQGSSGTLELCPEIFETHTLCRLLSPAMALQCDVETSGAASNAVGGSAHTPLRVGERARLRVRWALAEGALQRDISSPMMLSIHALQDIGCAVGDLLGSVQSAAFVWEGALQTELDVAQCGNSGEHTIMFSLEEPGRYEFAAQVQFGQMSLWSSRHSVSVQPLDPSCL